MTELYTNMRYLQYNTLQKLGLSNFDSWAATFGETQTVIVPVIGTLKKQKNYGLEHTTDLRTALTERGLRPSV